MRKKFSILRNTIFQIIIILLLLNSSILSQVQNKKIEKLKNKLKNEKTIYKKIKILNSILWESRYLYPKLGIKYGNQALQLEMQSNKEKAQTLSLMGLCYVSLKDFTRALKYFLRAKKIAEEIDSAYHMAHSYNNISNIYKLLGQYDKAYTHIFNAINLFTGKNNKAGIAYSLVNLGDLELLLNKFDKAQEYYNKALKIRKEMNDILEQNRILLRKADVSYKRKKYDLSLKTYKKLKKILEEPDLKYRDPSAIKYHYAVALSGISANYSKKQKYKKALKFIITSLDINLKLKANTNIIKNYNSIGKLYTELADYEKAFEYIKKGLYLTNSNKLKTECLKSLIELHIKKSEFKQAYVQYKKMTEINEALFNEKKNKQIEILRTTYEIQNKERKIILLKNKTELKNLQKNFLIIILIMFFLILMVIIIRFYQKSKTNRILNQQKAKLEKAYIDLQEMTKLTIELERKNTAMAMAVTASHEIKQPLTILQGNFELFTNKLDTNNFSSKKKVYISKINNAITRITEILNKYNEIDHFSIKNYDQSKKMIVFEDKPKKN